MDIRMHGFKRKNKLPSIAAAIVVHTIMLGLALQSSTYITPKGKNIVDLTIPIPKEDLKIEPPNKEIIKPTELTPPKPYVPDMPPLPNTTEPPVIMDVTSHPPLVPPIITPLTGGEPITHKHAPIYQQASVDSNACEKPAYPSYSLRMGEEGVVNLAMQIGVDGRVIDAHIEKSSGSRYLDKAAMEGLSLCKFKPASTDGVPEKSWAKLQYSWKMDN